MDIYTDGSSNYKTRNGSCSVILIDRFEEIHIGKFFRDTTNNRMELMAVIIGILFLNKKYGIIDCNVYSDSKYVIDGITQWIINWKNNNWLGYNGNPIKNIDLWKKLDMINRPNIKWIWIKGHNDDHYNCLADNIAGKCSKLEKDYYLEVKKVEIKYEQ